MTGRRSPGWSRPARLRTEATGRSRRGQRLKPNYGGTSGAIELHLSHWRGPLAQLVRLPELGLRQRTATSSAGSPTRPRRVRLQGHSTAIRSTDTGGTSTSTRSTPAYGKGWHRENSFLTHHRGHTLGDFCYGFFPHAAIRAATGTKYRATAGPGSDAGRDVGRRRHRRVRRSRAGRAASPGAKLGRPEVPRLSAPDQSPDSAGS